MTLVVEYFAALNYLKQKAEIMKKIFLATGIVLLTATGTFAHNRISRMERKEASIERRALRKELRREKREARFERIEAYRRFRREHRARHHIEIRL
jgi:hypothetical protein